MGDIMKNLIIAFVVISTMTCVASAADAQEYIDIGTAVIKNSAIGAYDTVKPLVDTGNLALKHGRLLLEHSLEALTEWKDKVLAVYNAENASEAQPSLVETSSYVAGSVATISVLLYVLYAAKISKAFKIPLSLLLVPSGVPTFVGIKNLVKQIAG